VYKTAKLTDVCGIGEKIANRLNKIGIYSLLQLRDVPLELLLAEFGNVEAHFLKQAGLGIDDSNLISYTKIPEVKSVGRNYCLPRNEYNKRVIYQNIFALCEEVALKLRRLHKKAQTIGLGLRGSFHFYKHKTVTDYIDSGIDIFRICKIFLEKDTPYSESIPLLPYVRMISVWAGSLQTAEDTPMFLFENSERKIKLQKVIDSINEKFGNHTVRNGFLLYSDTLTTQPNGYMVDRFERTKLARDSAF